MNHFRRFLYHLRVNVRLWLKILWISLCLWPYVLIWYWKHLIRFLEDLFWFIFRWLSRFVDTCILLVELMFDLIIFLPRPPYLVLKRLYEAVQHFITHRNFKTFDMEKDLFKYWPLNEVGDVLMSFFQVILFVIFVDFMIPLRMVFSYIAQFMSHPISQFCLICSGLFLFVQQQEVFLDSVTRSFWNSELFKKYGDALLVAKTVSLLTILMLFCGAILDNR